MTKDEAMKLALEALEAILGTLTAANEQGTITDTIWFSNHETLFDYITSEIDRIKEALAQPEPMAIEHCLWARNGNTPCPHTTPPQRTWVGLTDEEVEMLVKNQRAGPREQIRYIEAKVKEKNT